MFACLIGCLRLLCVQVVDLLDKTAAENESSQTLIEAVLKQQSEIQRAIKKALQTSTLAQ